MPNIFDCNNKTKSSSSSKDINNIPLLSLNQSSSYNNFMPPDSLNLYSVMLSNSTTSSETKKCFYSPSLEESNPTLSYRIPSTIIMPLISNYQIPINMPFKWVNQSIQIKNLNFFCRNNIWNSKLANFIVSFYQILN